MSQPAVRRIAILGAESSGKSTLAAALADHYGTLWVPEYLREFVDLHQRVPRAGDQVVIARTQLAREHAAVAQANTYLFCDTAPVLTAVYSRFYFEHADAALDALAAQHDYDLTFVTAPDTPWVADGLQRESESVRQTIYSWLLEELQDRGIAYGVLAGSPEQRLDGACAAINRAATVWNGGRA